MIFKFHDAFLYHTNFQREIEIKGKNKLGEALEELFNQYPQLYIFWVNNQGAEARKTSLRLNGEFLWEQKEAFRDVCDTDVVVFGRDIPEGQGAVGKIIAGIVLIIAIVAITMFTGGVGLAGAWAAMGTFGQMGVMLGVSLVISGVAEAIIGTPKMGGSSGGESTETYSFSGIKNSTAIGTPVGVVYGTHRVGGHLLNVYTDVEGKDTYLYAQLGLCEGEVADISDIEINKNPLGYYQANSYSIWTRTGTADQAIMENFNRVENTVSSGVLITNAGHVPHTTSKSVNAAKVVVTAPSLFFSSDKDGPVSTTVTYRVEYKRESDVNWTTYADMFGSTTMSMSKKSKSEVTNEHLVEFPTLDKYLIRVLRLTADHSTDLKYSDSIYLKAVNEINYDKFIYPHTAMLGVRIKATDQISGNMPTITSLVKGAKVLVPSVYEPEAPMGIGAGKKYTSATWDGTWASTKKWTNNPVWCLYDLLTNPRYGVADEFKIDESRLGLMKAQFFMMAKYCDELVTVTVGKQPNGTPITVQEPRYQLNLVVDGSKTAAEWIATICSVMQANLFYTEGRVWLDIDRPKTPTALFNMSNMEKGSFTVQGTSYKQIPNVFEVQYPDKDNRYEYNLFRAESYKLQTDPFTEERKRQLNLIGSTNVNQCKRLAKYALMAGEYNTKIVSFKTGTYAMQCLVGDVIAVQHDVPQWGFGGKVIAYDQAKRLVEISAPFDFSTASVYEFKYSHNNQAPETVGVSSLPVWQHGTYYYPDDIVLYDGITYIAKTEHSASSDNQPGVWGETTWEQRNFVKLSTNPPTLPVKSDTYIIGMVTNEVALYKVVFVKRDSEEIIEVRCVGYTDDLYQAAEDISDISIIDVPTHTHLRDPFQVTVTDVKAEERLVLSKDGNVKVAIDVFFTPATGSVYWKSGAVYLRATGSTTTNFVYKGDSIDGNFTITEGLAEPAPGTPLSYDVLVVSNFKDGTRQAISDAMTQAPPPMATVLLYGKQKPPADVASLTAAVDAAGFGVILSWPRVTDLDLSGYELRQVSGGFERVLETDLKGNSYAIPMLPAGSYQWKVRALDTSGNYSLNFTSSNILDVSPPGAVVISYTISGDSVVLTWTAPSTTFSIKSYKVSVDGVDVDVSSRMFTTKINWSGDKVFSVTPYDAVGNAGTPAFKTVTVTKPVMNPVSAQVVNDTLVLKWSAQQTSLSVEGYEVSSPGTVGSAVNATLYSTTFSTNINWHGDKVFSVVAVDSAGNKSTPATVTVSIAPPSIIGITYKFIGESVVIDWTVLPGSLPITSYRITSDAVGTAEAVDRIVATRTYSQRVNWKGDRVFTVKVIDTTGIDVPAMNATVSVVVPGVVTGLLPQVIDNNVLLKWDPPTVGSLPVQHYELRKGVSFSTAPKIGTISGTFNVIFESIAGTYTYWVVAVDTAGNYGAPASTQVYVNQPPDYMLYDDRHLSWIGTRTNLFIDIYSANPYTWNFWNTVDGWSTIGATLTTGPDSLIITSTGLDPQLSISTLNYLGAAAPILRIRMKRNAGSGWDGKVYYKTEGHSWSDSYRATMIQPANFSTYQWVEVDMSKLTAGDTDYMRSQITGLRLDFGSSAADVFEIDQIVLVGYGQMVPDANLTETYQEHFTSRSWSTPQDQLNAGYSYYIQPMLLSASYSESIDYGAVIGGTKITVDLQSEVVFGTVNVSCTISVKENAGDAWTVYPNTNQVFATNFRYLKVDLAFSSNDKGVLRVVTARVKLDMKSKTEAGVLVINTLDTAAATVSLLDYSGNPRFVDVQSINITAQGNNNTSVFGIYDFVDVPYPTNFKIYLFDSTGNRVTGTASWTVRGV